MTFRKLLLLVALTVGIISFPSCLCLAQVRYAQIPPDPPGTPPPNQTKPGGGLGQSNTECETTSKPLTALIPVTNPVLTTSEHPTFLFYIPYGADKVRVGEFSILVWPKEDERIYETRFTLPQKPGIVSLALPSGYTLAEGHYYHWYFKLYCRADKSSLPDLDVDGWVQRVAPTPERQKQIKLATPDIWYDALASLASRLRTSPQDEDLRSKWSNLLKSINFEDLAVEPLVGSVIPLTTLEGNKDYR